MRFQYSDAPLPASTEWAQQNDPFFGDRGRGVVLAPPQPLPFIFRRGPRWCYSVARRQRLLAVLLSQHHRAGSTSPLSAISDAGLLRMILDAACPDRFPPPARTTGALHQAANGADSSNCDQEGGGRGASPARSVSIGASGGINDVTMAEAELEQEIQRSSKESAAVNPQSPQFNAEPVTSLSGCLSPRPSDAGRARPRQSLEYCGSTIGRFAPFT